MLRLVRVAPLAINPGLVAGGVIDQARWRQRRRRLAIAAVLFIVGVLALAYVGSIHGYHLPGHRQAVNPAGTTVASSLVLVTGADLGCIFLRPMESPPCQALGLTVSLKRPAVSVAAWLSGRRISLGRPDPFALPSKRTSVFEGKFKTAQLPRVLARGVNLSKLATYMVAPALVVELQVDYGAGHVLITSAQAALQSDWCG